MSLWACINVTLRQTVTDVFSDSCSLFLRVPVISNNNSEICNITVSKKPTFNSKQQTLLFVSSLQLYFGFSNIFILYRGRSSPWQLLQSPCSKWMIKKRWRGFTGGWYAWHPKSPPFAPSKPSGASYSCPPNKPTILYLFLLKYWCMLWKV